MKCSQLANGIEYQITTRIKFAHPNYRIGLIGPKTREGSTQISFPKEPLRISSENIPLCSIRLTFSHPRTSPRAERFDVYLDIKMDPPEDTKTIETAVTRSKILRRFLKEHGYKPQEVRTRGNKAKVSLRLEQISSIKPLIIALRELKCPEDILNILRDFDSLRSVQPKGNNSTLEPKYG